MDINVSEALRKMLEKQDEIGLKIFDEMEAETKRIYADSKGKMSKQEAIMMGHAVVLVGRIASLTVAITETNELLKRNMQRSKGETK